MKLWIFAEGSSEKNFAINVFYKFLCDFEVVQDQTEFINTSDENRKLVTIEDCEGGANIANRINSSFYRIKKSGAKVLIICDQEKSPCLQLAKRLIIDLLDKEVDKNCFYWVISRPIIEAIYWDDPECLKKALNIFHKIKFEKPLPSTSQIPPNPKSAHKIEMQTLFRKLNLNYRPSLFSEEFFSRFDYANSKNVTVARFYNYLSSL